MSREKDWTRLLAKSDADRLFLSWDWQSLWWDIFGTHNDLELLLLAAHDAKEELVGIAPLYLGRTRKARVFSLRGVQFIGNIWRGPGTVRTEYLDFIADVGHKPAVLAAFADYLSEEVKWDEFILTDLDKARSTYRMFSSGEVFADYGRRYPGDFSSFFVDTTGQFKDYLAGLGAKTRLKLYNRRKYLESLGKITLERATADNIDGFFDELNRLHGRRWDKDLFTGKRLEFHRRLTERLSPQDAVNFCLLCVDGKPQSALYNIRIGRHDYGIQGGFNDKFDKKITLGALHYGYMIESAFDAEIDTFDFLAGDGKLTGYKNHYTTTARELGVVQVIRSPLLRLAYRVYDFLKSVTRRGPAKEDPSHPKGSQPQAIG